jgi:quinol monooxygenase YgiN
VTDSEIIVLGTARGSDGTIDELLEAALAHVHRSRDEPGCVSHAVHRDVEDPNLLVFVEHWTDRAALDQHFAVTGSGDFLAAVQRLAVGRPTLEIYEATRVS